MLKIFSFFSFFLFTACGYHFDNQVKEDSPAICVPYVSGDQTGLLTSMIVQKISSSRSFQYVNNEADLQLKVKIIDKNNSVIGYRHDRYNDGNLKKTIMPTEGRESVTAEVCIVSLNSGNVVLGPYIISVDKDYDFVEKDTLDDLSFIGEDGNRQRVLAFSLGQMESIESAQTAALTPLYRNMAQKIVDLISAEW